MTLVNAETAELVTLDACEEVIEKGLSTFIEVGTALATIAAGKLYAETHATFEAYCDERWGIKRQRAYELMQAAGIVEVLSEISDNVPAREAHAAELAPLRDDPDAMARAVRTAQGAAAAEGRNPTAADYRAAVDKELGKPQQAPPPAPESGDVERSTTPEPEHAAEPPQASPTPEEDEGPAASSPPASPPKPRPVPPKSRETVVVEVLDAAIRKLEAVTEGIGPGDLSHMGDDEWSAVALILAERCGEVSALVAAGGRQRRQLKVLNGGAS